MIEMELCLVCEDGNSFLSKYPSVDSTIYEESKMTMIEVNEIIWSKKKEKLWPFKN